MDDNVNTSLAKLPNNRFLVNGLSASLLITVLAFWSPLAFALDVDVSCSDVTDPNSCSITGQGSFTSELSDNVNDVLETLQSGQAQGRCSLLDTDVNGQLGVDRYQCVVSDSAESSVSVICEIGNDTARCEFENNPELIDMSCTRDGDSGSCNISTSRDQINSLSSRIGVPEPLLGFSNALIETCASFAGSPAVRRDCAILLDELDDENGNPRNIVNTLREVAPLNSDSALSSTQITVVSRQGHVFQRLQRLRSGPAPTRDLDVSGLQIFDGQQWLQPGTQLAATSSDTSTDVSPDSSASFNRLGVFLSGSLVNADHLDDVIGNGSQEQSQLLTWGIDYRINENWVGGLVFSGASTTIDYNSGRGDLSNLGLLLTTYAGYYNNNFYLDTSIGIGGNEYDQTRIIRCSMENCGTEFNQSASSSFGGSQLVFAVSSGYDVIKNAFTFTPFAQIVSSKVDVDGYRETASSPNELGAGFVFDLDSQSRTNTIASVGVKSSYTLSTKKGVFVPDIGLEFVTELNNDDLLVEGSFIGNTSDDGDFRISTRAIDDSYLIASGGAQFLMKNSSSVFINGRYIIDSDRLDLFEVSLGLRLEIN